ncbi:general alpha-glucoside permease [Penicillium lagena]|uniref:general alpha-glucoside permease n=1 Tax=Penicillium lagena TaxID=94218 RepID=UPI002540ABFD|nr:general alpha-glucoside permease [Penicillium lagena]KAJ5611046.1 general alpha-glucoside permease [Penicillium lagena]
MADAKEGEVVGISHRGDEDQRRDEDENDNKILIQEAAAGFANEKHMGPRESIKAYPQAIMWSLVMALCVIMEGYDTALLGNFFAYPAFQIKFGRHVGVTPSTPSGYLLSAPWQAGVSQSTNVGGFIGAILNGWLVNAYGQRRVVLWSLIILEALIFIPFFAPNLTVLLIGEFLLGIPWATLATCAISYASEVLPPSIRTYLTSYTNMCFVMGQLIAAGVIKGLSNHTSQWAYRIPFAIQWVWPVFLIPLVYMAPESPWYLVRKGRLEDAEKSLRRLQSSNANIDPKDTLATIIHTDNFEKRNAIDASYWDCIKGTELRRTEIACMTFAGQVFIGINFAFNNTYFFQTIGVGTSTTFSLSLGGSCLGLFGCFINWFGLMPYFGRRTIYLWGVASMCIVLFLIGILNVWTEHKSVALTQAILSLVWTFIFQLSAGQLGWSYPAEVGSTRLRQMTICIARDVHAVINIGFGILQQYLMNPTAWNVKGYVGFIWGSTALMMFIWAYFRLPEVWNRPYEELDILFTQKVSARKFASTPVNPLEDDETILHARDDAEKS